MVRPVAAALVHDHRERPLAASERGLDTDTHRLELTQRVRKVDDAPRGVGPLVYRVGDNELDPVLEHQEGRRKAHVRQILALAVRVVRKDEEVVLLDHDPVGREHTARLRQEVDSLCREDHRHENLREVEDTRLAKLGHVHVGHSGAVLTRMEGEGGERAGALEGFAEERLVVESRDLLADRQCALLLQVALGAPQLVLELQYSC